MYLISISFLAPPVFLESEYESGRGNAARRTAPISSGLGHYGGQGGT